MNLNEKPYWSALIEARKSGDEEKWLALAGEAIRLFPNEEDFKEELQDARAYYVHKKLKSKLLDQLEEKGDYLGVQAIYLKLFGIFPESNELQKALKKIQLKINKNAGEERIQLLKKAEQEIQKLIESDKLDDAERACYEVLSHAPERREFIHLLAKTQNRIDKEIEKGLTLYYKMAIPALQEEYKTHQEQFIQI